MEMKVLMRCDNVGVFYGKWSLKKGDLVEISDAREIQHHLNNKTIELQNPTDLTRLQAQIQADIRRQRGNFRTATYDGGSFMLPID
jgi:hypothetical protein